MSKGMKRGLAGGSIATLLVTVLIVTVFSNRFSSGEAPEVREIVLEARDLAFAGDNPTLQASPGERIRLVVHNTDGGVVHAISIPGIDSQIRQVKFGETISFEITVPQGGTFDYVCPHHAPKMQGKLVVAPAR